jgi:hypothetical protein
VFADASPVEAQAPLASENDTPAKPNAGRALLRRLGFFEERFDMVQFSHLPGIEPVRGRYVTSGIDADANLKEVMDGRCSGVRGTSGCARCAYRCAAGIFAGSFPGTCGRPRGQATFAQPHRPQYQALDAT